MAEFNPATGELRIQNAVEAVRMEPRDPDMPYKSDPSALTPIEVEEKRQYMNRLVKWSLLYACDSYQALVDGTPSVYSRPPTKHASRHRLLFSVAVAM